MRASSTSARSARPLVAVVVLLGVIPSTAHPAGESGSDQQETSWYVPSVALPTSGGGRSGEGGPTRTETTGTDVSAARLGVTNDLPEWLRQTLGKKKPATEEPSGGRSITWAPIIT